MLVRNNFIYNIIKTDKMSFLLKNQIIVEDWQGYVYHINENGQEIKYT